MALKETNINPRVIELDNTPIAKGKDQTNSTNIDTIVDKSWVKQAFLVNDTQLGNVSDISNRYWSSASVKFTDTRLGGNIGINSRPQFTRYSDIRVKGRLSGRADVTIGNTTGNFGMGRYYSEAIDDPSQTIYLRFGVPQFNSLTNFLSKAFDPNQTSIARTGRAPSAFYTLGQAAGTAASVIAFPAISMTILAGKFINSFFVRPTSKFYTLKPSMHIYWSTVNTLVNTIAINKGIFPKISNTAEGQKIGEPFKLDTDYLTQLSNLLPDVFTGNSYFDMYAIANKAQRIANVLDSNDFDTLNNGTATDFTGYVKKDLTGKGSHATPVSDSKGDHSLSSRINEIFKISNYKLEDGNERLESDPRIDPNSKDGSEKKDPSFFQKLADNLDSEFRQGSQYAIFKVDATGSVSESFGNSVIESNLSQNLNSTSSRIREARFSFAEGDILGGTGIGGMVQSAIGAVGDVAAGVLDGATFGFGGLIAGLGGSGFIDIPKHWQSSSVSLPRSSYSMQLISPYGNIISQIQNIYIPLCMLLAGCLPLSTGKQSYTSPFLCELFDRGRCQVRLGMIESLSITRGTSNLPFDIKGNALAIDVTFSIVDMSSIMHMPVSNGKLFEANMTLDEDNVLADYLAVLAGQGQYSQTYPMAKAQLTLAKKIMATKKLHSPAYLASLFHESSTSGMLQYITFGAFNALEGAVRGSSLISQ
jgi:hypothetical protein